MKKWEPSDLCSPLRIIWVGNSANCALFWSVLYEWCSAIVAHLDLFMAQGPSWWPTRTLRLRSRASWENLGRSAQKMRRIPISGFHINSQPRDAIAHPSLGWFACKHVMDGWEVRKFTKQIEGVRGPYYKWQGWVWRRLDGRVPGFDHGPILRWWDFGNCAVPRNSTIQCTTAPTRMLFCTIMHSVLLLTHSDEPNKKINTSISPYCTAHPNQEYAIPPQLLVWSYFTILYHTAQNCSVLNEGHFSTVHW